MNLSKNLIVALLGLGCYARSNSINLANNTTILLIILALMAKHSTNDDNNIEIANNTRTTINGCACANDIGYTAPTSVVCSESYPVANYTTGCYTTPRNACHYATPIVPYQTIPYCSPYPPASWNHPRCNNYPYPCHNILY